MYVPAHRDTRRGTATRAFAPPIFGGRTVSTLVNYLCPIDWEAGVLSSADERDIASALERVHGLAQSKPSAADVE